MYIVMKVDKIYLLTKYILKKMIDNYCNANIQTHDGITVKFFEDTFEHAFYTRTQKKWKAFAFSTSLGG